MRGAARGSVLITVVVLTAVMGLIAALILRSRLQASTYAASMADRVRQDVRAQSAINQVQAAWALAGATCASGPGVTCAGSGCLCACTTSSGGTVRATPRTIGAACDLTVAP